MKATIKSRNIAPPTKKLAKRNTNTSISILPSLRERGRGRGRRVLTLLTLLTLLCLFSITLQAQNIRIKTGIEVLKEQKFKCLEGKRVGLITNPTGVDNNMKSTIDILHEAPNVNLVALFGPEHGVRGDVHAGDHVTDMKDATTGLPVYSLYGKTRKATPEMLKDIDVLVYDIQDIGCRSYTYISTMGLAMEAAAENGKE